MNHDLSGRVALVTGASRGLGAAIARKLGACGARVAVNYFGSPDKAEGVAEQIRRGGGEAVALKGDVRNEAEVAALVSETQSRFGPIDILVPNATGPQPFIRIEELDWRKCLDQLEFFVKSPMLLTQAVVGGMKQRRFGRIVNIGSEVLEKGVPEFSNYVSAKGAQLGLTRSWAMELAERRVTVNVVAPGPTDTPMLTDPGRAATPPRPPALGRFISPTEVAALTAFLLGPEGGMITGQQLVMCGGASLGLPPAGL